MVKSGEKNNPHVCGFCGEYRPDSYRENRRPLPRMLSGHAIALALRNEPINIFPAFLFLDP